MKRHSRPAVCARKCPCQGDRRSVQGKDPARTAQDSDAASVIYQTAAGPGCGLHGARPSPCRRWRQGGARSRERQMQRMHRACHVALRNAFRRQPRRPETPVPRASRPGLPPGIPTQPDPAAGSGDGPFMRRGGRIAPATHCRKAGEPRAIPCGRMHPLVDIVERKAAGSAPSRGKPADCVQLGRKCGYFLTSICPSVQSFPQVGSVYAPEPR